MAHALYDLINLEYGVIKYLCVESEQSAEHCMRNISENKYWHQEEWTGIHVYQLQRNCNNTHFFMLGRFLAQLCERRADIWRTFVTFIDLLFAVLEVSYLILGYLEDEGCHLLRNVSAILPLNST